MQALPRPPRRRPHRRYNENIIAVQGSDGGDGRRADSGGGAGHDTALFTVQRQRSGCQGKKAGRDSLYKQV